jgi:enoyl-CoA hydratase
MRRMRNEILSERDGPLGIVRINRGEVLNALSENVLTQLTAALTQFDADPDIRCLLLTGDERAFASGGDVAEMADASPAELQQRDPQRCWEILDQLRKPLVAAVTGYATGSGCGLALACDIVVAGENARFGHPELNLGIIPGAGSTQRWPRLIGRARTMDLILTGHTLTAHQAFDLGLVSRLVPSENCQQIALEICRQICQRAPVAVQTAKEAIRKAYELPLREGMAYERKLYYLMFATDDQKEGMRAFLEKRPPVFAGR